MCIFCIICIDNGIFQGYYFVYVDIMQTYVQQDRECSVLGRGGGSSRLPRCARRRVCVCACACVERKTAAAAEDPGSSASVDSER